MTVSYQLYRNLVIRLIFIFFLNLQPELIIYSRVCFYSKLQKELIDEHFYRV